MKGWLNPEVLYLRHQVGIISYRLIHVDRQTLYDVCQRLAIKAVIQCWPSKLADNTPC